ncbi:TonB-dependent receptor [Acetobacter sacchari]|uniref:TonB-dependent receptor n=1 Tax=Acetobacter sacchari TaxID=2661687 RepID=A0ABS3LVU5_9PROT|nr:TonB-dependent receptor [Acetobacter sacchari]MBO1360023.1 TonB-dependent receptor [Acetobacter sacchari]
MNPAQAPNNPTSDARCGKSAVRVSLLAATVLASTQFVTIADAASSQTSAAPKHVRHAVSRPKTIHNATTNAAPVGGVAPAGRAPSRAAAATALNRNYQSNETEDVVVTGSMLRTARNSSPNPVQTITSQQIQQTGVTTLGDFLQRMPSIGSSGTSNNQTNGTSGLSCTDFRNMGQQRVLVLIDGKRPTMTAGGASSECFDMNTIPTDMVQSVEMLKDGGSELYGADAVSGVINIKLKHNVTDAAFTAYGGISGKGDALTGKLSAHKGWNFDHDKGNLTLYASYMTQGGIYQRDRSWANPVAATNPTSGTPTYGSSISPMGHFFGSENEYSGSANGTIVPWSTSDRYNYGRDQMLSNSLQNSTLSGDLHYEINKHFIPYANVLYSHRTSLAQMAAEPVTGAVPPSDMPASVIIPANDPYNTTGEDLQMYKRMNEYGPRRTEDASDTVTAIAGMRGEITHGWMYDASYTYGANMMTEQMSGVGDYRKLLQTYGLQQVNPSDTNSALVYNPSVCNAAAGCVLSSPFGPLSNSAAAYSNYTSHSHYHYQLRDLNVRINNDHIVKMPWKHGGAFAVALGMEHRGEQLSYSPDPLIASGESLTSTSTYTGGGFNVTEAYLEGKLTLLHNAFLARDLTIDGQGRFSSYDTFGSAKNWKGAINWSPTRDIRFRATIGSSFRQPNVFELYGGQTMNYANGTDPCAQASTYGAFTPTVIATCRANGIPNPSTFQDANSGQIPTLTGGNSKLRPETGRTWTVGTTVTPRWIPGLSVDVTYWHYNISNLISATSTQYIADQCYTGQNTGYCSDILRYNSNNQIDYVSSFYTNQGGLHQSGIDWSTNYQIRLSPVDRLIISNEYQQILNYKQQTTNGGSWINYTGALIYTSQAGSLPAAGIPRVRDYATATWRHGPFSVTYMMSFTGGMRWNNSTNYLSADGAQRYKTPGMVMNNISFTYDVGRWSFQGGINNINNKNPPYVVSSSDNSMGALYGSFYEGRSFWLQAGTSF